MYKDMKYRSTYITEPRITNDCSYLPKWAQSLCTIYLHHTENLFTLANETCFRNSFHSIVRTM